MQRIQLASDFYRYIFRFASDAVILHLYASFQGT